MSDIDPTIIDPGKPQSPPPDLPIEDPDPDVVLPGDVREPGGDDVTPIEPDLEEGGRGLPGDIERAS